MVRNSARLLTFIATAACGGTAKAPPVTQPSVVAQREIQVFTEPSAVAAVVPIGGVVFVATSQGLDRWEAQGTRRTRLGAAEGVTGTAVRALIRDRAKLWFATDAGVGFLDLEGGKATMMPPPPEPLTPALHSLHHLAIDPKGGVWVGSDVGLFHCEPGGWSPTSFREEITALHGQSDGVLWIGTRAGVIERNLGGVFSPMRDGNTLQVVRAISEGPDGAPVAVGEDAQGQARLAIFMDGGFTTFQLTDPVIHFDTAAHRDDGLVLAGSGRLVALHPIGSPVAGARKKIELLHVSGKLRRPPYAATILEFDAPPDITSLAAVGQALYFGTRTLGTSILTLGAVSGAVTQLRPRELVAGARSLSVACRVKDECYLATGGITAWRYDGRAFSSLAIGGKPIIVLSVVRSPQGDVLALFREPSERRVRVAKLSGNTFTPVAQILVEVPTGAALLTFSEFAPDGLLWLGLQYIDKDGDTRPYGVATVDLTLGAVSYHHEGADKKRTKVLPVPNDVTDIAFQGESTWFASGSGAARLTGEKISMWTEGNALRSELLRGVVAADNGTIYVASVSGVGQFNGNRWTYPEPINVVASSIARGLDGKLWIGTERGLIVYDGKNAEKLDRSRGLLDDRIFDVTVDFTGRVWARGTEGVSLVTP